MRRTLPSLDLATLGVLEVDSDIVHEVLLVGVVEDLLPERTGLLEVNCEGRNLSECVRLSEGKLESTYAQ